MPKFRIAIIWIVIATAAFRMIFEVSQLVYERLEYFLDITNLLEWCLYIFSILFVIDISSFDVEVSPASMRKVSCLFFLSITKRLISIQNNLEPSYGKLNLSLKLRPCLLFSSWN